MMTYKEKQAKGRIPNKCAEMERVKLILSYLISPSKAQNTRGSKFIFISR
jgi:hypothetical protein